MSGYLFALGTAFFWGAAPLLAKLGLGTALSPLTTAGVSSLLAIPPFWVLAALLARGPWKLERGIVPLVIGSGVLNVLGTLTLFAALTQLSVSTVSVLVGSVTPLLTLTLAHFFLKRERITWRLIVGTLLVMLGIYLVVA